jgi:hypothetical protein
LSVWFKTVKSGTIVALSPGSDACTPHARILLVYNDGTLSFVVTQSKIKLDSASSVADGTWHHGIVVYHKDRRASALYLDGKLQQSKQGSFPELPSSSVVSVGFSCKGFQLAPAYFSGDIANAVFWAGALDRAQLITESDNLAGISTAVSVPPASQDSLMSRMGHFSACDPKYYWCHKAMHPGCSSQAAIWPPPPPPPSPPLRLHTTVQQPAGFHSASLHHTSSRAAGDKFRSSTTTAKPSHSALLLLVSTCGFWVLIGGFYYVWSLCAAPRPICVVSATGASGEEANPLVAHTAHVKDDGTDRYEAGARMQPSLPA